MSIQAINFINPCIFLRAKLQPLHKFTSNWKENALLAALVTDVCVLVWAFFTGASWTILWAVIFMGISLYLARNHIMDLRNIANLETSVNKLEQTRIALNGEVDRLSGQVDRFANQNTILTTQVGILGQENRTFQNSNRELKAQNVQYAQNNREMEQKLQKFQGLLKQFANEVSGLRQTRVNLDQSVDSLDKRFKENLTEMERFRAEMKKERDELIAKLDRVNAALDKILGEKLLERVIEKGGTLSNKLDEVIQLLSGDIYKERMNFLLISYQEHAKIQASCLMLAEKLEHLVLESERISTLNQHLHTNFANTVGELRDEVAKFKALNPNKE